MDSVRSNRVSLGAGAGGDCRCAYRPSRAAMPIAAGVVMLIAGILQFTAWKRRQLECCRAAPGRALLASAGTAWRHGLQLGRNCVRCCASLTAALLTIGVMDLRAMAAVTALITAERLAPARERVARGIGVIVVVCGLIQVAKRTDFSCPTRFLRRPLRRPRSSGSTRLHHWLSPCPISCPPLQALLRPASRACIAGSVNRPPSHWISVRH